MAFTNPRTWVDNELVTAAMLNSNVRDNIRYLKGLDGIVTYDNAIALPRMAAPATPASGHSRLYADTSGMMRLVDDTGRNQRASYGSGTSFPGVWPVGVPFYREDLGWWAFHDGTRWLSTQEFSLTQAAATYSSAGEDTTRIWMTPTDYRPFFTRWEVVYVLGATNNVANYWAVSLRFGGATSIAAAVTQGDAPNTGGRAVLTSGFTQPATAIDYINTRTDVAGSPTPITYRYVARYRLVLQ